jgi:hypothetical protein
MRIQRATFNRSTHQVESTGKRGPSQTEPKHGKKNRIPYDSNHPKRQRG